MQHLSEEELESYLLGRMAGDPEAVEVHLLLCGVCLDWVQEQESTIAVMRQYLSIPLAPRLRKVKPKVMTANQGWLF